MTKPSGDVLLLSDGEIALWTTDDRSIHLKAVTGHGDPVELNAEQARELAAQLMQLALIVE
jgi:hypothetical protein